MVMRTQLLVFAVLAGCADTPTTVTYDLAPQLIPCSGNGPTVCMIGTDSFGESVTLYDGIEGFEFRWGETRRVTVEQHVVDHPAEDASSLRLELVDSELLATSAPADMFLLGFRAGEGALVEAGASPDRVRFAGYNLACEPSVCASIVDRLDAFALALVFAAPTDAVATVLSSL